MKRFSSIVFTAAFLFSAFASSLHAADRPIVSITSPKAGLRASNEVFTVTGRATDNVSVSNVFYRFNQSGWTPADTTNQWTNWSAQVTLTPGTNVISAYAVDNAGNISTTNSVRFIYVVLSTLTVHTNGNVTVKPNYNGAQLQIGTVYTMKGKSRVKGFGVRTWTDASNNVVGNGSVLRFTMTSNLVLTANFGDVKPPRLKLISSATNANGDPNSLIIFGTASDNVAVAGVSSSLGTQFNWQVAPPSSTTNNWTNWSVTIDSLQPGLNHFYMRAMDTSSNYSITIPVLIYNNTAPRLLAGKTALVQPSDSASYSVTFGSSTFSQSSLDASQVNGVGKYTYSASGPNGYLKMTYTAPRGATNEGTRNIGLYFTSPTVASYATSYLVKTNLEVINTNSTPPVTNTITTNVLVTTSGSMYFSTPAKLTPSNMVNQLVYTIGIAGTNGQSILFQNGNYTSSSLLNAETNAGKFTYAIYSPVGALFTLTNTSGKEYIVATFSGTNYGTYYSEDYDTAGNTNSIGNGRFLIGSQQPGGNAPSLATNQAFQIFSGADSFNVILGDSTYSQDTLSTNFDNAVGNYFYNLDGTNVGQLDLTVTEPPTLAGSNSAARLIFVAPNAGLFTNADETISMFLMSTATNLLPTSVENRQFSLTDNSGYFPNELLFTNNNEFLFNGTLRGSYEYAAFSPVGAMVHLNFTTNTDNPGLDWLQLKFNSTNSGRYYVTEFDLMTNAPVSSGGTFQLP